MKCMDEMRQIRKLTRSLENEYGQNDGYILAERLVKNGITELTEGLKEKIQYLRSICETVSFNDYWTGHLIADIEKDELKERYAQVVLYTGKEKCRVTDLVLSCEEVHAFGDYLKSIGFDEAQTAVSLGEWIRIGSFAKSLDDAKETVRLLNCFELTETDRNRFIYENFSTLFSDYSRNLDALFVKICEKYGKEEGFRVLCRNPLMIRMGMQEMSCGKE